MKLFLLLHSYITEISLIKIIRGFGLVNQWKFFTAYTPDLCFVWPQISTLPNPSKCFYSMWLFYIIVVVDYFHWKKLLMLRFYLASSVYNVYFLFIIYLQIEFFYLPFQFLCNSVDIYNKFLSSLKDLEQFWRLLVILQYTSYVMYI